MEEKIVTQETTTVQEVQPEQVTRTTTQVVPPPVKTEHPQKVFEKKKVIFRTHQIIWYILAVIEVLLGFRMALMALGANPASGFTNFIYAISNPLALPFRGILPINVTGSSTFEWTTIIAAIVYAVIAYGIVYLIQMLKPVTPHEVSQAVDSV